MRVSPGLADKSLMQQRLLIAVLFLCSTLLVGRAEAQFRAPQPPAVGEDYRVEVGAMFWTPSPELIIRTDALGLAGSDIDFVQEFGIEDKRFTEFRAVLKPGRTHKLRIQYIPIRYEADAILQRRIVFGGRTYDVGVPAATDIEWTLWRLGYEWDFVSNSYGFVGLVAELKYNDVKAQIDSPVITGPEVADAKAPVPAIGIIGRGYLSKNLSVTGEFGGFKLPDSISEKFEAEFWDFDIYATVNFGRNFGVQGGYRRLDVEYIVDEDTGRLKMKGLYWGGVLRF